MRDEKPLYEGIIDAQRLAFAPLSFHAALALRGLRTLGLRLQQETASAIEIAAWLAAREREVLAALAEGLDNKVVVIAAIAASTQAVRQRCSYASARDHAARQKYNASA